jgi:spore cortex formation protein SpoVR/YcgB (stage V sporulation)
VCVILQVLKNKSKNNKTKKKQTKKIFESGLVDFIHNASSALEGKWQREVINETGSW